MSRQAFRSLVFGRSRGERKFARSMSLFAMIAAIATPALGSQFDEQPQAPDQVRVGLIWWPVELTEEGDRFSRSVGKCLSREIEDLAPNVQVVSNFSVRSMLYPLMESETQPDTEEDFGNLLASAQVRTRLAENDLHFLLALSGRTQADDWSEGILCGGGYQAVGCLGFSWSDKETQINAALWTIDGEREPERLTALQQGTSIMPAVLLPIPIPADTQTGACKALSNHVVEQIEVTLRAKTAN